MIFYSNMIQRFALFFQDFVFHLCANPECNAHAFIQKLHAPLDAQIEISADHLTDKCHMNGK